MRARLLLLDGADAASLRRRLEQIGELASHGASIDDPAFGAEAAAGEDLPLRAALVAASAEELLEGLHVLSDWLDEDLPDPLRTVKGVALGRAQEDPRIGFLFPGQGAPVHADPGFLTAWLPEAAAVYDQADALPAAGEVPDKLVQLSVVTASVAGIRALRALGVEAGFGLGHSVGELTAFHWSEAIDEETVLRLARRRGEVMTEHATADGAMANIEADEETFARLIADADVSVACVNSPRNRVVSGTVDEIDAIVQRALAEDGARALPLRVVGAFHSPLMRDTVPVFERFLAEESLRALQRPVYSTVTGTELDPDADLKALLIHQMTEPVHFLEAAREATSGTQLLLEVGPGRMLSTLVSDFADTPTVPLRIGHSSPQGLLSAVGAAYAIGVRVRTERLLEAGDSAPSAAEAPGSTRPPSA
jgi:enediyne polyketide synthase